MLRYQVKSLLTDPSAVIPVEENIELEQLTVGGDHVQFLTPCHLEGQLKNIGGGIIRFIGTLDMQVRMACSRCTKDTDLPLHATIEQRYIADRQQGEIEDDDIEIYENELIDLSELVDSEISMAVPMKVLCREDCKGLCPICGKDLNEGSCDCEQEDIDPRWDALKSLLQRE